MKQQIKSLWNGFVQPMLRRPEHVQFAALCYDVEGPEKKILLITSRGTRRWILPKGWPIDGLDSHQVALQEAWEEAGVLRGKPWLKPLGSYHYRKGMRRGWSVPVNTIVYPVRTLELSDRYPEVEQRTRRWVSPSEAAELVGEPELKELLATF